MDYLLCEKMLVIIVLVFFSNRVPNVAATNATYPALFAFGDSILDTGNNNDRWTLIKGNHHPYGRDFEGEIPTGRFCNGKVPTDIIAGAMGIKQKVPAFLLHDNLTVDDLATGVSFASGGSGNDNFTAEFLGVIKLSDQLENFKAYIQTLDAAIGPQKVASIISNGLYLISAGNNDIAITYNYNIFRGTMDFQTYADNFLVFWASDFLNSLYQLGARHVWVLSTLPLGCLPSTRTLQGGLPCRPCSDKLNNESVYFNSKLEEKVSTLKNQTNLPNFDVRFIDVYNPMLKLMQNAASKEFTNVANGCCGTGVIEIGPLCNSFSALCQNTSSYFFWDSAHPTQRAYELIVDDILKANNISKSFIDSPTTSTRHYKKIDAFRFK